MSAKIFTTSNANQAKGSEENSVRTSLVDGVFTVILDRPERKNAVDGPTAVKLFEAFKYFDKTEECKIAILYGANGIFCAGADLTQLSNPMVLEVEPNSLGPMGPSRMMLSKPVIAAVEGFAVAGGLELACWCDLRVCAEDSTFGVFCRRWGVPLIDGGTVRLPRLIGHSRAMDLILTGRPVDAKEALAIGLANRVVPKNTVLHHATLLAREIISHPSVCMKSDRMSALEQWNIGSELGSLSNEFVRGLEAARSAADGVKMFTVEKKGRGGKSTAKL